MNTDHQVASVEVIASTLRTRGDYSCARVIREALEYMLEISSSGCDDVSRIAEILGQGFIEPNLVNHRVTIDIEIPESALDDVRSYFEDCESDIQSLDGCSEAQLGHVSATTW